MRALLGHVYISCQQKPFTGAHELHPMSRHSHTLKCRAMEYITVYKPSILTLSYTCCMSISIVDDLDV